MNMLDDDPPCLCGPTELHGKQRNRVLACRLPDDVCNNATGQEDAYLSSFLRLQQQLWPEHSYAYNVLKKFKLSHTLCQHILGFLPGVRPPSSACHAEVSGCSANLELFMRAIPESNQVLNWQFEALLDRAWEEDSNCCLRLLIRMGERRCWGQLHSFYDGLDWLWKHHPLTLLTNLRELPKHGSWVDLCELLARVCEGDELTRARKRAYAHRKLSGMKHLLADDGVSSFQGGGRLQQADLALTRYYSDPLYRSLFEKISEFFACRLMQDLDCLKGCRENPSDCARWCPGLGSSYDRRTLLCEGIAKKMFPRRSHPEYNGLD